MFWVGWPHLMPIKRIEPEPEKGAYLHDGTRLFRIAHTSEGLFELEDCADPGSLRWLTLEELSGLTPVRADPPREARLVRYDGFTNRGGTPVREPAPDTEGIGFDADRK